MCEAMSNDIKGEDNFWPVLCAHLPYSLALLVIILPHSLILGLPDDYDDTKNKSESDYTKSESEIKSGKPCVLLLL